MRRILVALVAATTFAGGIGCGKSEEPSTAPPSSSAGGTPPTTTQPVDSTPMAAVPDFSSDEAAAATLQGLLKNAKELEGTSLRVEAKDKTLHIIGDVKNNDQKRKIDEITKGLEASAKAAGYSFMNMAIVKG